MPTKILNLDEAIKKGVADGVASLDSNGKVPLSQLSVDNELFVVVNTLDEIPDPSNNKIYLVPKTGSNGSIYDEYIYIDNDWELIGSLEVDLSDYYTKSEIDQKIPTTAGIPYWHWFTLQPQQDINTSDYVKNYYAGNCEAGTIIIGTDNSLTYDGRPYPNNTSRYGSGTVIKKTSLSSNQTNVLVNMLINARTRGVSGYQASALNDCLVAVAYGGANNIVGQTSSNNNMALIVRVPDFNNLVTTENMEAYAIGMNGTLGWSESSFKFYYKKRNGSWSGVL